MKLTQLHWYCDWQLLYITELVLHDRYAILNTQAYQSGFLACVLVIIVDNTVYSMAWTLCLSYVYRKNKEQKPRKPGKIYAAFWKVTRRCILQFAGAGPVKCSIVILCGKQFMKETERMSLKMLCSSWQRRRKRRRRNSEHTTGSWCYKSTIPCLL